MNKLYEILENVNEDDLENIFKEISRTGEFRVLAKKTQIKNSAVEKGEGYDDSLTNRQKHSFQASQAAYEIVKASGRSEKEAQLSRLVGLCHDLGHTPFGHDGEEMFSEKTGKEFEHAKYGAKLFQSMFKRVLNLKHPKTGKNTFKEDTREDLEKLQSYIVAGIFSKDIIENMLGLIDYIKSGVNFHQEGYYSFELYRELKELREKYKDENGNFIIYNERLDLLEKALENPCVQAGMLADTVSIMQSDVRDMAIAKNPYDTAKTIISLDDQMEIAKRIGFTRDDILKMQEQLSFVGKKINIEGLDENEALHKIIETLGKTNVTHIQRMMAKNIGKQNSKENGRFESISDEYKMFADNYKEMYEKYKGKKLSKTEWEKQREEGLQKQRKELKAKNPILCLTYEIQNSLIYGKILNRGNIKILNNDLNRNKAIFSRTYDFLYKLINTKFSELTNPQEIELKKEMNAIYKFQQYPKQFDEIGRDGRRNKSEIVKNLIIYKIQQMGNIELKEFYDKHVAEQENSILQHVKLLEKQGKSEDEILQSLQGINLITYYGFKRQDEKKVQDIENLRGSKTDEEIALKLGIEKRDFDELIENKSSIRRYIEYRISFDELLQITDKSQELDYKISDEVLDIDDIDSFNLIAEMHDQRSEQFGEDITSAKYNIPAQILQNAIKKSEEQVTARDISTMASSLMEKDKNVHRENEIEQENSER